MSDDQSIEELEVALRLFGKAWAAGDASRLEAMLARDYTHVDASGAILHRDDWLEYARGRAGRGTTIGFRDVGIRRHGEVAIATGVTVMGGGGIRSADDPRDLSLRFTQVWIRAGGHWLREAFQGTPIEGDPYS
jgi:ketosteroid isomerase-like protein